MRLIAVTLATVAGAVHAHPGHPAVHASHWHASDTWGFIGLGALVLLAVWLSRGGK